MPGRLSQLLSMMNRTKKRTESGKNRGYSSSSSDDSSYSSGSDSSSDDSRPEEEEERVFGKKSSSFFGNSSNSNNNSNHSSKKKSKKKTSNKQEKVPLRTCTVQCSSKLGSKHMYNEDTYLATFDIASATKRRDAKNSK